MRKSDEYQGGSCIGCGYALRGLSSGRCPECGREFDPGDPATFHKGQPISRLSRLILRPISIAWVGLALIGMLLTLLATRWPTTWRWPMTDLPLYWEMAKKPREKFVTQTDWYYTIGIAITAIVLAGWLLRVLLQLIVAKRMHIPREDRVDQRRRHALIAIAGIATAGMMAFGWPFRLARLWVARNRIPKPITTGSGLLMPRTATNAVLPIPLSDDQKLAVFRAALMELPTPAERMEGLKLFIEEYPGAPLPTLIEALQKERDPSVIIWLLRSIGLCKDPETLPRVESFLTHRDQVVQVAAINAIGVIFEKPRSALGILGDPTLQDALDSIPEIGTDRLIGRNGRFGSSVLSSRMPEPTRLRLVEIMTNNSPAPLRQAAAYALTDWPGDGYRLRIAEWGVWIADGTSYELTASILDEIPTFVHQLGNISSDIRNAREKRILSVVTKPIIHTTTDRPMALDLEVYIRQGRPWFAYPVPDDFELLKDSRIREDLYLDALNNHQLSELKDTWEGHNWMTPKHQGLSSWPSPPGSVVGIGLRWQSLVVIPKHQPWMREPAVPNDAKYQWWNRLRQVSSSWVWNRGEADRFLYYDGPTKANAPVTVKRNGSSLAFSIVKESNLSFLYVAPLSGSGSLQRRVDAAMRPGIFVEVKAEQVIGARVIAPEENAEVAMQLDLIGENQIAGELLRLLTARGLTEPEAMGLIDAWRPQFFRSSGARLILIMSSADYETLCPIKVRPAPTEMVRVGIILTEFSNESVKD